mmetsp:Transcript_69438/g.192178  ORF Transcript_69438/g.192178 Transcript_69438/m.192178 type:complete len:254 (-) Transcript_69438:955-1716(-)
MMKHIKHEHDPISRIRPWHATRSMHVLRGVLRLLRLDRHFGRDQVENATLPALGAINVSADEGLVMDRLEVQLPSLHVHLTVRPDGLADILDLPGVFVPPWLPGVLLVHIVPVRHRIDSPVGSLCHCLGHLLRGLAPKLREKHRHLAELGRLLLGKLQHLRQLHLRGEAWVEVEGEHQLAFRRPLVQHRRLPRAALGVGLAEQLVEEVVGLREGAADVLEGDGGVGVDAPLVQLVEHVGVEHPNRRARLPRRL